jgi:hypothetical protein
MSNLPILLFVMAALCGCQRAAEPGEPRALPEVPFRMELEVEPAKLFVNKAATLRLNLRDERGIPVTGARVTAELGMPLHDMGESKVEFVEKGSGTYEASATFSMEGPWEVNVTVEKDRKSGKKLFDLRVYE